MGVHLRAFAEATLPCVSMESPHIVVESNFDSAEHVRLLKPSLRLPKITAELLVKV